MAGQDKMPVVRKSDEIYHIEDFECGSVVLSVTYLHHGRIPKDTAIRILRLTTWRRGKGRWIGDSKRSTDHRRLCVHQSWCVSQGLEQRGSRHWCWCAAGREHEMRIAVVTGNSIYYMLGMLTTSRRPHSWVIG